MIKLFEKSGREAQAEAQAEAEEALAPYEVLLFHSLNIASQIQAQLHVSMRERIISINLRGKDRKFDIFWSHLKKNTKVGKKKLKIENNSRR